MAMTNTSETDRKKLNRYLDALTTPRRRYVLYYLHEHTVGDISELAEYVLRCESGRPTSEISEDEYESIRVDLYHNHLPQLTEYGLVSFDRRSNYVRMESPPMMFLGFLWICHAFEDPP